MLGELSTVLADVTVREVIQAEESLLQAESTVKLISNYVWKSLSGSRIVTSVLIARFVRFEKRCLVHQRRLKKAQGRAFWLNVSHADG